MKQVVLDTDVWSFLFKRDTRAERYRVHLEGCILCVSFQTVAELYQWAEASRWGESRRAKLRAWLRNFEILGYDDATAQLWARIRAERNQQGHPLSAQDAWVAACSLRHGYPLLTHNAVDYAGIEELSTISEQSDR
jgi:predicted nucleic acid-binding protein